MQMTYHSLLFFAGPLRHGCVHTGLPGSMSQCFSVFDCVRIDTCVCVPPGGTWCNVKQDQSHRISWYLPILACPRYVTTFSSTGLYFALTVFLQVRLTACPLAVQF